jgi:hypothetical protein
MEKIRTVLLVTLFISICFAGFAQTTSETNELGYILFSPDSTDFENFTEAKGLLDRYAKNINEISSKNKQIHINGYTAIFDNDIDPIKLSSDRANTVLKELVSRGISTERFDIIKGNGGTEKFGNNLVSEYRKLNRRVTISIDIIKETPQIVDIQNSEPEIKGNNHIDNRKDTQYNSITQQKSPTKINWKKVVKWVVIGLLIVAAIILIIYFWPAIAAFAGKLASGAGITAALATAKEALASAKAARAAEKVARVAEKAAKTIGQGINSIPQKQGGYFGELKYQIRDAGQNGTKEVHHMPSNTALFNAKQLDQGSAPAIIMDKVDHALTASHGSAFEYQTKQLELIKAGKFDDALQMDINDLKNKGLYEKYKVAIDQMLEYVKVLKKEGRL